MTNISVKYPIVGAKVIRGKDWDWYEQDGGSGNVGTITKKDSDGWVVVKWSCGGFVARYRIGDQEKYDLYFATTKDALLQVAIEKFPSGCSYETNLGEKFRNVTYEHPYWYEDDCIALKANKGLIYSFGRWATRIDIPSAEVSHNPCNEIPLPKKEVFPGIYVGDIVVSLTNIRDIRKDGDIFKVLPKSRTGGLFYEEYTSSSDRTYWRLATPEEMDFYNNGGKNINDMKRPSPLELCRKLFSVGDIVETTIGPKTFTEIITQKILDNLSDTYNKGFVSCSSLNGWLYNAETKQYAKIINSQSNINKDGNSNNNTGLKIQRPNLKVSRSIGARRIGLKSPTRQIRFGSGDSSYQK
jgi:hypothetical protein